MLRIARLAAASLLGAASLWCFQTGAAMKPVLGTVTGFKMESLEIQVKADTGEVITAKLQPYTIALKLAPGETDLKKAETIKVTDVVAGDRVLATVETASGDLRRLIVMSAGDIAKRNAADRATWQTRGVSGAVAAKKGDEITVRIRNLQGESVAVVTVNEKTSFKRYAPDSVKFADALPAKLADIGVGDELRARGQKSADGAKVAAEEVVFGSFETRAGSVTAVNAEAHEITVKDLTNGRPLVIRISPDTQIKKMPATPAAGAAGGRSAAPAPSPAGATGGRGTPQAAAAQPPAASPAGRGSPAASAQGAPQRAAPMSIPQLLEAMPTGKFEEIKPGQTVVASSTRGARKDQITAIMLVANADMLIQIAEAQAKTTALALGMAGMSSSGSGSVQLPGMGQ
jgi:hypothetical protein